MTRPRTRLPRCRRGIIIMFYAEASRARSLARESLRRGSGGTGQAHEPVPTGAGHYARASRGAAAAVASTVASRGIGSSETASRGARGARGGRRIEEKGIAPARKSGSCSPQKVLRERLTEDCIPNPVCLLCTRIPPTSVCCTHEPLLRVRFTPKLIYEGRFCPRPALNPTPLGIFCFRESFSSDVW